MHPSIAASAEVDQAADARFRRLYADHGRALFAYALRRTDSPDGAAEVLSDTFLVAWRRARKESHLPWRARGQRSETEPPAPRGATGGLAAGL
jgi:RNA polymerase sigma-70 factor (ECF subfamily)